ncbi:HNH endonuclease signature motif containing protein [Nocardioides dongkuii]|uniref:HNH endonuclease signature motif containing protein n=1 Tax=Nocardioides dongkuii TaxID=2760089 RepID=UPI0015FBEC9E|nr:HNH endonuclease signature motif containing protein [Nocardioides dongkuii]
MITLISGGGSMDTRTPDTHPVLGFVAATREALKDVADANPVFMTTGQKAQALVELTALESQVAELRLRVTAADDVAEETGTRDVAAWVAHRTRQDTAASRADARLATALDREHPHLAAGLREGSVSLAQARVIAHALAELPADLGAELRARAEEALVGYAAHHAPGDLRRLGRRILACVDPDAADEHEARLLEDAERTARERTKLSLRRRGDGTTRISGLLPDAAAHRLATYLESFTNPRKDTGGTATAGVGSYSRRLGQAFVQLLETIDPRRLPLHGGDATTMFVVAHLDQLTKDLGVAEIVGGGTISAGEARRLACNAHLVPAVLGGASEVLDLGRRRRLYTAAQRRALLLRDRTCRAEGCDIPGTWAEAHHWVAWAAGGATDLANGTLLCHLHHHRAHDAAWSAERLPNGDVRYARRR